MNPKGLKVRQAAKKLETAMQDIASIDTASLTAALEHGPDALQLQLLTITELERVLEVMEGIEGRHQLEL